MPLHHTVCRPMAPGCLSPILGASSGLCGVGHLCPPLGILYKPAGRPSEGTSGLYAHRALQGSQSPGPVEGITNWTFFRPALRMHHADAYIYFCEAGLVLRGPHQMLPSRFLSALTLINSAI